MRLSSFEPSSQRRWTERAYPDHDNRFDRGGHFAALEQPELSVPVSEPRSSSRAPELTRAGRFAARS
jgi:hypothetical protein